VTLNGLWRVSSPIARSRKVVIVSLPTQRSEIGLSVEAIAEQSARRDGVPGGTTIAVTREVAGRTRGGEAWTAANGVAVAAVIRPPWRPEEADIAWILAASAGVRSLQHLGLERSECQWPDVLCVGDHPVGRSFARTFLGPGVIDFAVLSVRLDIGELLSHGSIDASTLEEAVTEELDRAAVLSSRVDTTEIRREFIGLCRTVGQTIEVDLKPKGYIRGTVVDLAESGGIVVESATGMREVVTVDSLRRIRPMST